jgi:flagellum-specific peptidoglycan hydrolase FlgJ
MTQPTQEAIQAAQAAQRATGVPAQISLAQWAQESAWGKSMPPGSNNPFGIKAVPGDPEVACATHEVIHGERVLVRALFRKFPSLDAAFFYHAQLLATHPQYAPAMACLPDVNAFCRALTGVYATDPNYGGELVRLIESEGFARYDVGAVPLDPAGPQAPDHPSAPAAGDSADALNAAELARTA